MTVPLTLYGMGLFWGYSRMKDGGEGEGGGGGETLPTLKSATYFPTMMTLGAVTIYLKKIKNIYKSQDIRLDFCKYQPFFIRNYQLLLY